MTIQHQPKGGLCAACIHRTRDCSFLRFDTMPVIEADGLTRIVRCTDFQRRPK